MSAEKLSPVKPSWEKPDFREVSLCMEVTAYVNAEEQLPLPTPGAPRRPQRERATRDKAAE